MPRKTIPGLTTTQIFKANQPEWPVEVANLRNDRERAFVTTYCLNGGNGADAARQAGYGDKALRRDPQYFADTAYRLLGIERIRDAVDALSKRTIRTLAPKAVEAVSDILDMPHHKDRLRAADLVLNRIDPAVQKVDVTHTHKLDVTKESLEYLAHLKTIGASRDMLVAEFGELGLTYYEELLAKRENIIDAEFTALPAPTEATEVETAEANQKEEWE